MIRAKRVVLFRGPAAFEGRSMRRYATELDRALSDWGDARIATDVVSPSLSSLICAGLRLRGTRRMSAYVGRFPAYMRQARGSAGSVNHIMDHAYGQLAYVLDPRRTVVTCHDLFPLKLWRGEIDGMPRRRIRPLTFELSIRGMRRAAAVIVPSDATKADLLSLGYPEDRVFVVPHGVSPLFRPYEADELGPWPFDTARTGLILTVDSGVPYKNPRAGVEVLARVVAAGLDVRLVRVGGSLPELEWERARRYGVADRVLDLGHIPDIDLAHLYSRCDLLLFPSFYEGFGWPVLEAMACGTPVVRSTWASLEEVAGNASLAAAARDYDTLANHVRALLIDDALAGRLARAGRERAAHYTWRRAAERTVSIYVEIDAEAHRVQPSLAEAVG